MDPVQNGRLLKVFERDELLIASGTRAEILNITAKNPNGLTPCWGQDVDEFISHEVSDPLEYHLVVAHHVLLLYPLRGWEVRISALEEGHETGILERPGSCAGPQY